MRRRSSACTGVNVKCAEYKAHTVPQRNAFAELFIERCLATRFGSIEMSCFTVLTHAGAVNGSAPATQVA